MGKLGLPQDVKKKQKIILFTVVGGLIAVVIIGLWASDPNRGKPSPREIQQREQEKVSKNFDVDANAVTAEESWISQSEQNMHEVRQQNKEMAIQLKMLQEQLEDMKRNGGTGQSSPSGLPVKQSNLPPPPPPPAPETSSSPLPSKEVIARNALPPAPTAVNQGGQGNANPVGSIQMVSLTDEGPGGEKEKIKNVATYLPTGSFTTAVLLSGIDAPTGGQAQTSPVPVLLRMMDDGQLPNYFNSDVQDCHIVGAAWGEISSERAHIRLETLSCVLLNGDIIEVPVKGYVAGEDGKAGLRGRLVEKQGSLLAKSLLAGVASGMGNSLTQQYQQTSTSALGTVTTIDPNKVVEAGLTEGASTALDRLAEYYIDRANEMYPIIEVDANRIGEVVLTGGSDLGRILIGNTRDGAED